ncbi:MAG: sigma-54 dependent transcriptional regulator [Candidatus Krumholzibacteria bacterium]|nr:sigma-54 dependent transcriptional regulator [Candidatus Krumholzibacteria bacterium]
MGSLLNVLCEVCGAERARVRLAAVDGGRAVIILDQKIPPLRDSAQYGAGSGTQIPLLDFPGCVGYSFGAHREASYSICGEDAVANGVLLESEGRKEWRMRRRVNGFDLELDLLLRERAAGFINDRLSKAAAFFDLFEAILDGRHFADLRREREYGGVPAFDPPFIGEAPAMIDLKRMIGAVAASDISLLIEGESGTGKEVVAQNVHRLSRRQSKPLIIASALEMPHSLLQSELFGHAEGAFTGASRERAGLIESASGGTFFLDEIGEMPPPLQAALLRVLQEKEIRRLGESRRRKVDVRFVFATNRDLLDLVRKGRFRKDLYFRIAGVRLCVPPLRARKEDILPLASFFLARCARQAGHRVPPLSPEAVRSLIRHQWPGNVRELRNEAERIVALHGGAGAISGAMLSTHIGEAPLEDDAADSEERGLYGAVQRLEREMIRDALRRFAGNRTRAAAELGITRQGLLKKLKRFPALA